jgi:hypothetical protein
METTEFDDWPLELGPISQVLRHGRYERLSVRTLSVLFLAFKTLKVIKENPSIFNWRMTITFFGDLIGLVFPNGLVFRLVVASFW